jgi:anion transporter
VIGLGESVLFSGLPAVELARLLAELHEVSLPAGGVMFRRGDPGDAVYIVRSGVAESRAGAGGPTDAILGFFQPGDNFGEMALLNDEPRSATVVAVTDVDLWVLSRDGFNRLVEKTPSVALALARLLSDRLRASAQVVSRLHQEFDVAAEEKYAGLSRDLQLFLCRTAPLDPVAVDVAAHALRRPDAGQVLRELAARVPFISPDGNGVYRYHRLFREFLLDKLGAELRDGARAQWLRELAETARAMDRPDEAVALYAEAGELSAAEALAIEHARALLAAGQHEALAAFVGGLPAAVETTRGTLADLRAELLVASGRPADAVELLEEAMHREVPGDGDQERRAGRARRLAELSFQLGRDREGARWLREAGEETAGGEAALDDLAPLDETRSGVGGLLTLASRAGLRRTATVAGTLGGRGISRPLGVTLAVLCLIFFAVASPPAGLARPAFLALGILVAALPLLIFSVLADHLVTLLMVVAWATLGLVPTGVALSGFANSGWFLVLGVLGVGVALARTGLLYRLVLAVLVRVPARHGPLMLALAVAGIAFSPVTPNATARTALGAPLVPELASALGYAPRSQGSAALAMAALLGFGQMCSLFLTGSSSGLLVHSLLPPASRARFGFIQWFLAGLWLHVVIFVITWLAIVAWLRPERAVVRSRDTVRAQLRILGPMTRGERVAIAVLVALVLAFVAGPAVGLDPAWAALVAMVALGAANVLDAQAFRGINWQFMVFFGVMLSLGEVFHALGVDAWLAARVAVPLTPLGHNPTLFILAVALAGYAVNFFVRWQAACGLMTLVLVPVALPLGIEPWIVGMTALVTTNMWFLPYQSTIYQALYYGTDEKAFAHGQVRKVALAYGVACLAGLAASVPLWRAMGLLP